MRFAKRRAYFTSPVDVECCRSEDGSEKGSQSRAEGQRFHIRPIRTDIADAVVITRLSSSGRSLSNYAIPNKRRNQTEQIEFETINCGYLPPVNLSHFRLISDRHAMHFNSNWNQRSADEMAVFRRTRPIAKTEMKQKLTKIIDDDNGDDVSHCILIIVPAPSDVFEMSFRSVFVRLEKMSGVQNLICIEAIAERHPNECLLGFAGRARVLTVESGR